MYHLLPQTSEKWEVFIVTVPDEGIFDDTSEGGTASDDSDWFNMDSEVIVSGVETVSWLLGFIVNTHINTIVIVIHTMAAIIVIIGAYLFFFFLLRGGWVTRFILSSVIL